ncbi:OPT oligopeptide transporter protein-domain-containing protein, partial [Mycena epipterygia]
VIPTDIHTVPEDLLEAAEYAQTMSSVDIEAVIRRIVEEHSYDPNFPPAVLDTANLYLFDPDLKESPAEYQRVYDELKVAAALMVINSPYAEVRAVVDNHDDPSVPASTFRTWVIGTIFVCIGGFINQFFSIRFPGIGVGPNVAQICAVPVAKLMELLPTTEYTTFGYSWSLNPGPFNAKEHMLITIMANVGFASPYRYAPPAIIWIQYLPLYFNQPWALGFGYQILVALSTNLIGYGLAGLTRRFIVYPAHAIWYAPHSCIIKYDILKQTINRPAFHLNTKATVVNGWRVSRLRWFFYCFGIMFCYYWLPDFMFQALSSFNWMTWISPKNVNLAVITGNFGLGLNPLPTLDWNQITVIVDPLISPFFVSPRCAGMLTLFTLPVIAAIWYTNTWNTGYLPINTNTVFDTASFYNVTAVIGTNTLFNQTLYEEYSPAYLSASYAVMYGVFFATYTATLTHTLLYHRREIAHGFRSTLSRRKTSEMHADCYVRIMENYTEVPEWQYFMVLVCAIALGAAGVGVYPTQTSPAVVLYGVFLALIFAIPIGIIASVTNVEINLNVLSEMFGGLWFKGNAVAMNYFKSYGFVTTAQTISFASDLKLAHYCHISPRLTFWAQIYATIISSFVCTGVLNFQMTRTPDVCTAEQVDHYTCPNVNIFFTASVLWGTLGPKRMFGTSGIYDSGGARGREKGIKAARRKTKCEPRVGEGTGGTHRLSRFRTTAPFSITTAYGQSAVHVGGMNAARPERNGRVRKE